jgi:hypothetical protein
MIKVLQDFQHDPSVITLAVNTEHTTVELLQALTDLFQCDRRLWKTVKLQLSSIRNPGTMDWQQAMQQATETLQQVAASRGISFST